MKNIILFLLLFLSILPAFSQNKPTRTEAQRWLIGKIERYLSHSDVEKERNSVSVSPYIVQNKLTFYWKKKDESVSFETYFYYRADININEITDINIVADRLEFSTQSNGVYLLRTDADENGIYDYKNFLTMKLTDSITETNLAARMMKCINDLKTNQEEKY